MKLTRYRLKKHIKLINGFEFVNVPLCEGTKEDGTNFLLTDPFGNTSLYLNAYKFTKMLGAHTFKYLSDTYRKSPYMTECGNGMVELPQEGGRTIRIPVNQSFIAR